MSEQVLSVKAVEMKGLSFGYRGSSVLYKVDFQLNAGDYAIFTGENGSGKSTFLKLLLGELLPEEGGVEVFGMPPSEKLFRRFRIGYVAQNSISGNQHFPATVREVMMTGLQYFRTKRMEKRTGSGADFAVSAKAGDGAVSGAPDQRTFRWTAAARHACQGTGRSAGAAGAG